jgi:hypothetical protein
MSHDPRTARNARCRARNRSPPIAPLAIHHGQSEVIALNPGRGDRLPARWRNGGPPRHHPTLCASVHLPTRTNPASRTRAPICTVRPMSCRSQPRVFWLPRPYPSTSQCPRGCHRGLTWHNPFEPAVPPGTDFAHTASFNCHLTHAVRLACVADTCPAMTGSRREASGPSGDLLGSGQETSSLDVSVGHR